MKRYRPGQLLENPKQGLDMDKQIDVAGKTEKTFLIGVSDVMFWSRISSTTSTLSLIHLSPGGKSRIPEDEIKAWKAMNSDETMKQLTDGSKSGIRGEKEFPSKEFTIVSSRLSCLHNVRKKYKIVNKNGNNEQRKVREIMRVEQETETNGDQLEATESDESAFLYLQLFPFCWKFNTANLTNLTNLT